MKEGDEVSLLGEVVRRSEQAYAGGWGFGVVRDSETSQEVKIVGPLIGIEEGMTVQVKGTYVRHPKFGAQIKISLIWEDDPRTLDGMIAWMDKRLPQIGPKRTKLIISTFGADQMFAVIENEPEKLLEIPGINEERMESIVEAYEEYKGEKEIFVGLFDLGFNKVEATRVIKQWQTNPLEKIQENPFILYGTIRGFTFRRLDEIRKVLGLPEDMPGRLKTLIIDRAKRTGYERGHTVREFDDFLYDVCSHAEQDDDLMIEYLSMLIQEGQMSVYNGGVMLRTLDAHEDEIATKIKELLHGRQADSTSDQGDEGPDSQSRGGRRGSRHMADQSAGTADDAERDVPHAEQGPGHSGRGPHGEEVPVESAKASDGGGATRPPTSVEPGDDYFDLGYWGGQGAGIFKDPT